jgi:hypothetical protein
LRGEKLTPGLLWNNVKTLLQPSDDAYLLFDDTVLDKRHSASMELTRRQYSGNEHRVIRGIGLISCVYVNGETGQFWVKAKDRYLYRAVDSTGQTLDFLLNAKRDTEAAKRFFRKALKAAHNQEPRVINVDKNAAYPKAIDELKAKKELPKGVELRQNKYLNNRIEQDHRFIKRLVKPGMGFGSFNTARRTIKGYEIMNMLRKGQVKKVEKGAVRERVKFIAQIFEVAA